MKEKAKMVVDGKVILTDKDEWYFLGDDGTVYSSGVCSSIDEILETESSVGERFRITIERLGEN